MSEQGTTNTLLTEKRKEWNAKFNGANKEELLIRTDLIHHAETIQEKIATSIKENTKKGMAN